MPPVSKPAPTSPTPRVASPTASADAVGALVRPKRYEGPDGREAIDRMRDLCRWYVAFCEEDGDEEEDWDGADEAEEDEAGGEEDDDDEDWDDEEPEAEEEAAAQLVAMGDTMFVMHCLLTSLKYRTRKGKKANTEAEEDEKKAVWYRNMARHVQHADEANPDPRLKRADFVPYEYQEPSEAAKADFLKELNGE